MKCSAACVYGMPCLRQATHNDSLCWQHKKMNPKKISTKKKTMHLDKSEMVRENHITAFSKRLSNLVYEYLSGDCSPAEIIGNLEFAKYNIVTYVHNVSKDRKKNR